jgi:Cu-Zn family superoxide dismutase
MRNIDRLAAGALIALAGCATAAAAPADAPEMSPPSPAPVQASMGLMGSMQVDSIEVTIINRQGQPIGTAYLTQDSLGVRVRAEVSGLTPGEHGLHIHSRGACDPPEFKSAGPHYQPEERSHGFLDPQGPHAGDLPMLGADAQGNVDDYDFTTAWVRLSRESLLNPEGTALIIHAQPDNYLTDTGGSTGPRIACGVISPAGSGVRPM